MFFDKEILYLKVDSLISHHFIRTDFEIKITKIFINFYKLQEAKPIINDTKAIDSVLRHPDKKPIKPLDQQEKTTRGVHLPNHNLRVVRSVEQ